MHNNGRRPTPLTQKEFRAAIARGLAPPASVAAAPALAANASPARIGRPTRRGADVRGGSMCPPGFKQPRKKTTSNPERRSTGASRLTHGRAGGYNLLGSEGVKRFAGQPSIPGEHRISSVHDNLGGRNNYTCTICRLLVHQGLLKNPCTPPLGTWPRLCVMLARARVACFAQQIVLVCGTTEAHTTLSSRVDTMFVDINSKRKGHGLETFAAQLVKIIVCMDVRQPQVSNRRHLCSPTQRRTAVVRAAATCRS